MINRRRKPYFLPVLSRGYNAIERMFCRLEDLCPIATRYDRLAVNFLAAVCLAATISYWLRGRILVLAGSLRWPLHRCAKHLQPWRNRI